MKKRIVAILMAAVMVFSMAGCGSTGTGMDESITSYSSQAGTSGEEGKTGSSISEDSQNAIGEWLASVFGEKTEDLVKEELATNAISSNGMAKTTQAFEGSTVCFDMAETEDSGWFAPGDEGYIEWNTEEYDYFKENAWMNVKMSPFSAFAADVDTASYANVRRMLTRGQQVPVDAVRIEEMVNYFHYDYEQPQYGEPFSVMTEMAPCPWNKDTMLFMVGLATKELDTSERPDSNLVFLIDVSGSMDGSDRLGLVQRSFKLLCEELRPGDHVSIVTYASGDKVVLDGATGEDKTKICEAIEDLFASGGTNGSAGIQTAYELAEKYYIKGGNNRIILATDGDLNIGITDEGSLVRMIEEKAKSGVFLSVLGFGWGNVSDARMQALADHGNGNYNYIDNIAEARKVLIEEMGSTLFTVAKDVKLQVEFNPAQVKGYRLIGYENRVMAAEDFANDAKDGGEIGAGHQVTALYEVALNGSKQSIPEVESRYGNAAGGNDGKESGNVTGSLDGSTSGNAAGDSAEDGNSFEATDYTAQRTYADEYLVVNIRYKEPEGDTSKLLTYPVYQSSFHEQMSENLSWAAGVAQAGMILKKSEYKGNSEIKEVVKRLDALECTGNDDYRKEFVYLFSKYVED